ncbi:MAG: hypothetical protein WCK31_03015 [bacterium]
MQNKEASVQPINFEKSAKFASAMILATAVGFLAGNSSAKNNEVKIDSGLLQKASIASKPVEGKSNCVTIDPTKLDIQAELSTFSVVDGKVVKSVVVFDKNGVQVNGEASSVTVLQISGKGTEYMVTSDGTGTQVCEGVGNLSQK